MGRSRRWRLAPHACNARCPPPAAWQGAAATVKRVSLELGGNAPFIVFEDAGRVGREGVEVAVTAAAQLCRHFSSAVRCLGTSWGFLPAPPAQPAPLPPCPTPPAHRPGQGGGGGGGQQPPQQRADLHLHQPSAGARERWGEGGWGRGGGRRCCAKDCPCSPACEACGRYPQLANPLHPLSPRTPSPHRSGCTRRLWSGWSSAWRRCGWAAGWTRGPRRARSSPPWPWTGCGQWRQQGGDATA